MSFMNIWFEEWKDGKIQSVRDFCAHYSQARHFFILLFINQLPRGLKMEKTTAQRKYRLIF